MLDVVITNVENGHNPSTGVLTSPLCGTYVFHVSAVECSELNLYLDILLNNVSKLRLTGIYDSGYQTNMVAIDLQKGKQSLGETCWWQKLFLPVRTYNHLLGVSRFKTYFCKFWIFFIL